MTTQEIERQCQLSLKASTARRANSRSHPLQAWLMVLALLLAVAVAGGIERWAL